MDGYFITKSIRKKKDSTIKKNTLKRLKNFFFFAIQFKIIIINNKKIHTVNVI